MNLDNFIYRPPKDAPLQIWKCHICGIEKPENEFRIKFAQDNEEDGFYCVYLCPEHKDAEIENQVVIREIVFMSELMKS